MKRTVCTHTDLGSCQHTQLPDDFMPLRPDECAVCEAVVSDLFGMLRLSSETPHSSKNDNYFELISKMGHVCDDLPMRHPMMPTQRDKLREMCEVHAPCWGGGWPGDVVGTRVRRTGTAGSGSGSGCSNVCALVGAGLLGGP